MLMIGGRIMVINADILEAAARAVTGFDVTVRHRKPALIEARAMCHQSVDGERFIDLNPNMPRENYFISFLHELAHWKINNGELLRTDVYLLEPNTIDFSDRALSEKAQAEELAADTLAEKWDAWAKAHSNHNLFLMCRELAKAVALTQYEST